MTDTGNGSPILATEASTFTRSDGTRLNIVVVETDSGVHGYLNSCPHLGPTLDLVPGRFTDISGAYLMCSTHGALFEPETGRCIAGPCIGRRLVTVSVAMENGRWVLLDDPDSLPLSAI